MSLTCYREFNTIKGRAYIALGKIYKMDRTTLGFMECLMTHQSSGPDYFSNYIKTVPTDTHWVGIMT